jgi:hypothetical protein
VTATNDDPIRAEVERALHAFVDAALHAPARLATAVPRCVLRRAERIVPIAEPWRVARSLLELATAGGRAATDAPTRTDAAPAATDVVPPEEQGDEPAAAPGGSGDHLPIEDYESLAASQVVDRLPTLTPAELEAVRAFETAHRGRRTVLGRIEQLLA